MELTPKQLAGLREVVNRYKRREKFSVISGYAGVGKAQPNDTEIPTPQGRRKLGELKVGDYVYDRTGTPTQILGVFPQGLLDCYKITLKEGRTTYCNDEHIFSIITSNGTKKNMTVKEMLQVGIKLKNGNSKFFIPSASPVQYPEQQYDIPPYVIGAFLGDGSCKTPTFTGLCEKGIPEKYKRGSIQQRYELLQGLMDTNGSIVDNKYLTMCFTSTSLQLIKDVQEIVYSLGYSHLSVSLNKQTESKCYDLYFSIPNEEKYKFFSLPRKKNIALKGQEQKTKTKYDRLAIDKIERLDTPKEMVCIYVDNPEHLYLTNDYIVTHNTTLVKFAIDALNIPPEAVRYVAYCGKASEVLRKKGNPNAMTAHKLLYYSERKADGHFVYRPRPTLEGNPALIVVDEVSMFPASMWNLLIRHPVHILALGDPFQIPPIHAKDDNHLLEKPHVFRSEERRVGSVIFV